MSDAADVAGAVRRGVRLFNLGRYFTAQQIFETAWQTADPAHRGFLEALVQLAAGLHLRTRRGATQGAEHLIVRALVTLEDHRPHAQGIDVVRAIDEFDVYVRWLREAKRPHRLLDRLRLPRLHAPRS
jgi:predicted metal-dependent hydrolase